MADATALLGWGGHVIAGRAVSRDREAEAPATGTVADADQLLQLHHLRSLTVVATSYLLGASTRRMDKFEQSLGITGLSRSQVSVMAKDLDGHGAGFHSRPLDAGPYRFMADALTLKVPDGGRVRNVAMLVVPVLGGGRCG